MCLEKSFLSAQKETLNPSEFCLTKNVLKARSSASYLCLELRSSAEGVYWASAVEWEATLPSKWRPPGYYLWGCRRDCKTNKTPKKLEIANKRHKETQPPLDLYLSSLRQRKSLVKLDNPRSNLAHFYIFSNWWSCLHAIQRNQSKQCEPLI